MLELTSRTIIGIGLLVLGLLFVLYMLGVIEGFDAAYDAALAAKLKETGAVLSNQENACSAKESCSSCLDTAGCGWCPTAKKCVPKVNTMPIVPRAGPDEKTVAPGSPLFACPMTEFVWEKGKCSDFLCSTLKNCRECAGNLKCGWCKSSNTCVSKGANNVLTIDDKGAQCSASDSVTNSEQCPVRVCNTITDCEECTSTPGCSFCEAEKKCIRFQDKKDMTGKTVEEKDAKVKGCNEESALSFPSQCPSRRTMIGVMEGPTAADIASAQDNSVGGWGGEMVQQVVPSTGGPVSPAESSTVVTAPGVVRPVGAGSVRPSFPAAAGLDNLQGGPFEQYVQMLVKSELSALGVAEAAAEGFQAAAAPANAPLGEMVANATKQVQGSLHQVFGEKTGFRV